MNRFSDADELVYREAVRVVPGIMAARTRGDGEGAAVLFRDYNRFAASFDLSRVTAMTILWTATMHWALEMAQQIAEDRGIASLDYCQLVGMSAANWASEGASGGE